MSKALISSGLKMEIPTGYVGKIESRSSLALKEYLIAFSGLIDSDFRGTVEVLLFNFSKDKTVKIKIGDRIAQLVIYKVILPVPECVNFEDLSVTERGSGGFGSSDKKLDKHKFMHGKFENLAITKCCDKKE
jgi:dUTP pyrophosphatase